MNLIFDYDGTLHESIHIYAPAFRLAYQYLVKSGFAIQRNFSDTEISYWLGYSAKDMWAGFMPDLPELEKEKCSKIIGEEMLRLIENGKARLYPNATQVLGELKSLGYSLVLLSNCKQNYMNAHRQFFSLDKYFSAFYCTEDYQFAPKWQIFNTIKLKHNEDFIIIGDRFQDMEIAQKHCLNSIGCSYGYGNVDELSYATAKASSVASIPQIIAVL